MSGAPIMSIPCSLPLPFLTMKNNTSVSFYKPELYQQLELNASYFRYQLNHIRSL